MALPFQCKPAPPKCFKSITKCVDISVCHLMVGQRQQQTKQVKLRAVTTQIGNMFGNCTISKSFASVLFCSTAYINVLVSCLVYISTIQDPKSSMSDKENAAPPKYRKIDDKSPQANEKKRKKKSLKKVRYQLNSDIILTDVFCPLYRPS
jgi:hypothetical protein